MNFRVFFNDEQAVSPVIGVILMVAITVILAAVIGTFVLGLGDQVQQTAPNAQIAFDYTDNGDTGVDNLKITHEGGDTLDAAEINASTSGEQFFCNEGAGGTCRDGTADQTFGSASFGGDIFGSSGDVNAGSSETLDNADFVNGGGNTLDTASDEYLDLSGATVRVTWDAEGSDSSSTLKTWEGPDA